MKISRSKKNQGIAVIVALVAVTVLTILAGLFAYSMKVETHLASNASNDEQLLWMGRAGVERAKWVISLENGQPYDALNQIWAGGPGAGSETNGPLMGLSLNDFPVGDLGTVSIKIVDLERFVNINSAPPQQLQQIFTAMGMDPGDVSGVADCILDWIDPDDSTRPAGAESDYYQGQNPPYYAKNAPLDDISELNYIRGVTPEMYSGTTNMMVMGMQRHKLGFNAPGEPKVYNFRMEDVFTPFSSGRININTADATVLKLIPGMDPSTADEAAASIIKWRAGPDGQEGTDDDLPFQNPGQLAAAGVSPQAAQQMQQFITTKSTTFEVHVTARIADYSREFVAILYRNGANVQTVGFYWK